MFKHQKSAFKSMELKLENMVNTSWISLIHQEGQRPYVVKILALTFTKFPNIYFFIKLNHFSTSKSPDIMVN